MEGMTDGQGKSSIAPLFQNVAIKKENRTQSHLQCDFNPSYETVTRSVMRYSLQSQTHFQYNSIKASQSARKNNYETLYISSA